MLWCALLPYLFHTSTNAATSTQYPSYSQSVCLVLSPLYKKHSNFVSATASSRKMDWKKHCTAQLQNFLCPSAQTHWTTELHDQHTVLWKSGASREQGNLKVWDLQGHLLIRDYFSFPRVWGDTLWVGPIWQFMPTLNSVVVLLWLVAYGTSLFMPPLWNDLTSFISTFMLAASHISAKRSMVSSHSRSALLFLQQDM